MIVTGNEQRSSSRAFSKVMQRETDLYARRNQRSRALYNSAKTILIGGVPMQWMCEWPGIFPLYADKACGARLWDVDGNEYVDFCLGDTGAMFGHAIPEVTATVSEQCQNGLTGMLPSADSITAATELKKRFGLSYWQFAMTATDANRFLLRFAREITGRPKVLVFNGCYHGTVDETIASCSHGRTVSRLGNIGPPADVALTTVVVEFNDLDGVEAALAAGEIACILTEPAMTNIGIVLPDDGFLDGLRRLTRKYGTLLAIDETHTLSSGPAGYSGLVNLEADMLTVGKSIGGGVPIAALGLAEWLGERVTDRTINSAQPVAGIGGTLTANWLAVRALRVMLETVITDAAYAQMLAVAETLTEDVRTTISHFGLPWHATRLGARMEYRFQDVPPRNGSEAASGGNPDLERYIHLFCLNRGVMMTPMHNMLLASPATTEADATRHAEVFAECIGELVDNDLI